MAKGNPLQRLPLLLQPSTHGPGGLTLRVLWGCLRFDVCCLHSGAVCALSSAPILSLMSLPSVTVTPHLPTAQQTPLTTADIH